MKENAELQDSSVEAVSCGRRIKQFFIPDGVPVDKLLSCVCVLTSEGIMSSMLSSYAPYLIVDLGAVDDISKSGYYSGMVNAVFSLAQFFSSFFMGWLSDRIGRRPIILLGSFGSLLTSFLLGLSWKFWIFVMIRFLCGLMNGSVGVTKTYLGEITDESNRVQAFAYFGIAFGFGTIVGSFVGGISARPAFNYPNLFSVDGLFGVFPYFLPNLIAAIWLLGNICLSIIYLQENFPELYHINWRKIFCCLPSYHKKPQSIPLEPIALSQNSKPEVIIGDEESNLTNGLQKEALLVESDVNEKIPLTKRIKEIWTKWKYPFYCDLIYGVHGGFTVAYDALLPVWLAAPIGLGGFSFPTSSIGLVLGINAGAVIFVQFVIYRPFIALNNNSILTTSRRSLVLLAISVCVLPLSSYSTPLPSVVQWIFLLIGFFSYVVFRQCSMNIIVVFCSNCVYIEDLGTQNGIGQSAVCFFRSIGPFVITPIFAWTLEKNKFPINFQFAFLLLGAGFMIVFLMTFALDHSIDKPLGKRDPNYGVSPPPQHSEESDN